MKHYSNARAKTPKAVARGRNATPAARFKQRARPQSRRCVGSQDIAQPFSPPEDWHEPVGDGSPYRVKVQDPGKGYRHVVTPQQVRDRLAELPERFLEGLELVQLSRVTRKKQSFPCYGMQWGATLYLYPLEESLIETFYSPPGPDTVNESKMYGGRWAQPEPGVWTLTWTEETVRDYYLNNILIHELGHLLDERNSSYTDRERYAEWFAIHYGYLATGGRQSRRPRQKVRRRHHAG
ncbi:hypothetical protein KOR34_06080 [Posidoniimonas corsicana]|uniref:Uncharacterized protein n=1 Tax=Posidoniimonas corsicana TaxID=1938618 RepID=A0A5C5VAS6_9BACT|nr:hypothetical protein [Posidoniimonas corsicana]TWT35714.1 hypothetical protein KOR34_06080 [Posidoniimonas corsicana]